jgi:large subunit ribosomal protein L5
MARYQEVYRDQVVPALMKEMSYKNVMEVPRVKKITLNMGVGEGVGDKKQVEIAAAEACLSAAK